MSIEMELAPKQKRPPGEPCGCCASREIDTPDEALSQRQLAGLERCRLDGPGLRAQAERYGKVGRGAATIEWTPRRLLVRLDPSVDPALVDELLAVERRCCPFFDLEWEPAGRRLAIAVADEAQDNALALVAGALGVGGRS